MRFVCVGYLLVSLGWKFDYLDAGCICVRVCALLVGTCVGLVVADDVVVLACLFEL